MVRIGVVSDSHGSYRNVGRMRNECGRLDWFLHAGDHMQDAARIAVNLGVDPSRVRAVVGNCDYPAQKPDELLLEIEGVKIYLTHGHAHGVKRTCSGFTTGRRRSAPGWRSSATRTCRFCPIWMGSCSLTRARSANPVVRMIRRRQGFWRSKTAM